MLELSGGRRIGWAGAGTRTGAMDAVRALRPEEAGNRHGTLLIPSDCSDRNSIHILASCIPSIRLGIVVAIAPRAKHSHD